MENVSPEVVYPQLFRAFCRVKRIPYATWKEFMARTKIVQFKKNQVFIHADHLSTHSYFVIEGLVMSYFERNKKRYVKWIRSTNDYVFSADIFRIDIDDHSQINGENLMALEDTVAISVSHEDLKWLEENHYRIGLITTIYYSNYSHMYRRLEANALHEPEDRYENIQRGSHFSLERVPDIYLASYLRITLKELKEVRKARIN